MKPATSPSIQTALPALIAACTALLLYSVTLRGGFAYDFYGIVRADARLAHPHQWINFWTEKYNRGVDNLYRPLTLTLFALQGWLGGLNERHAWVFHLTSLLMHAGVCALFVEFARRITTARIALLAGLIFAVHPIHAEVLGDIVGQAEMLCAIGILGGMILFIKRPMTSTRAVGVFLCFLLALLSKEQGMLFPILLVFLAATRSSLFANPLTPCAAANEVNPDLLQKHKQSMQLLILLISWSLAAYLCFRERILKFWWDRSFLDPAVNPLIKSQGADRLLMPVVLIGHYTQLMLCPWKLAPDYSGEAIGSTVHFNDPYFYLGILAVGIWLCLCVRAIKRRAAVVLFCLLSLALIYGMVGNIIAIIGTNFAERLMYLPSLFFILLVAIGLSRFRGPLFTVILAIVLLAASVRTFTYVQRWNDRITLYEHAVRDQPRAVRMQMGLAIEYYDRQDMPRLWQTLQTAREMSPDYAGIWCCSAYYAIETNNFEAAEQYLHKAEALEPSLQTIALEGELAARRAATRPSK